ncbi:MAG: sel1 repeat family protein [Proteobacteria bacterium]|nr:sel1 repeat family protein [Pseudomonadota bacterium]MCL2306653.1 sel1 repeat family protein [Pseudomonadota bacterium]
MKKISKKQWQALTKSAEQGVAEAQWELGYYYANGAATKSGEVLAPQDKTAAISWYLRAAKQEYADAKISLSCLLSEGDHPDYKAAIFWAKSAIAQGNEFAAYNLGIIYRDLGKPKSALRYYQLATAMGDADAHLQIGLCHLLGHGTAINHSAAQESFQKVLQSPVEATTQRSRENALYWLALLNLMGLGHRRNLAQARNLLMQANADDDHEQANELLLVIGKSSKSRLR